VVLQLLLHPCPDGLDGVEVGGVAGPLHQLDVGPLLEPLPSWDWLRKCERFTFI
jgi:hypothetical protein